MTVQVTGGNYLYHLYIVMIGFAFLVVSANLYLSMESGETRNIPDAGHSDAAPYDRPRASLLDRNGHVIAVSNPRYLLYAHPETAEQWDPQNLNQIYDPDEEAGKIARIIGGDYDRIRKQLGSKTTYTVIAREITPGEKRALNRVVGPGIGFERYFKRVQPNDSMLVHAIGLTRQGKNGETVGISGIEAFLDERLRTRPLDPVRTSLDLRVQHAVRKSLAEGMALYRARYAIAIVMDAGNGEILAWVSLPDAPPGEFGKLLNGPPGDRRYNNHAITDSLEFGSTLKPFSIAAALHYGVTSEHASLRLPPSIRIGNTFIRDETPLTGAATPGDILAHSSNVGSVLLALETGARRQREFLELVGILRRCCGDFLARAPSPYPPGDRDISVATISYGYGISLSPVALLRSFATLVNGGIPVSPTFLLQEGPVRHPAPVISGETSAAIRRMLTLAVDKGTGKTAFLRTPRIGGKTGTANKILGNGEKGYHDDRRRTSFLAFFPADAPRYVSLVLFDEPQATGDDTHAYASYNAAPVTAKIISGIAGFLDLR